MSTGEQASGQKGTVPPGELLACEDTLLGPCHLSVLGSGWRESRVTH